jgi:plastocyanin
MLPIRYLTLIAAVIAVTGASFALPRAANAGGGCHEDSATEARSTTVALRNNCFAATVTRVDEGATVTFTNEDDVAHNVTGAGYTWGGEETLYLGDSVRHTFDENGVYVYSCLLHPGMVGAIVVGDGSGPGPAAAAVVSDEPRSASGAGGPAAASESSSSASDNTSSSGGASPAMIGAAIAGGIALLVAIAGGSMALARSSASRRTAVR